MIENKNLSWIYVGIHKEYNIPIAVSKTIEGLTNLIDHYMGYGIDTSIISKEYKAYNPRYGHNNYQGTHVYTFTDTNKEHISVYISDYYLTGDTLS